MRTRYLLLLTAALCALTRTASAAPNLVPNGDFEAGNSGFTSSYGYSPAGNGAEGQYTVRRNPFPWNGAFVSAADHTTGTGLMFVGNGSPVDGAIVWQSGSIAVAQNTTYFFEAWVMNVCCSVGYPGANSPSILDFAINGVSIGTETTDLANAGSWEGLSNTWNSGGATSAVLTLINRNTAAGGNDFAIDDIRLSTTSVVNPPIPEPASVVFALASLPLLWWGMRGRSRVGLRTTIR